MDNRKTSARFGWVAIALSFLAAGVGHIYCGRVFKGLMLYFAWFTLPILVVIASMLEASTGVLLSLILVPASAVGIIYIYAAFDAYLTAKQAGSSYELKDYNRTILYVLLIAMQLIYPIALTAGAREYIYEAFYIPTKSMSPTILAGDRILVNKRPFRHGFPQRGDVVVFRTPASEVGRNWVKRVIGVAGDRIVIKGREIEVNGKKLERERVPPESIVQIRKQVDGDVYYESHAGRRYRVLHTDGPLDESIAGEFDVTVPDRSVFVLGDNRDHSRDSRHIGSIHVGDVIGYVDYMYFPAETWSRFGAYRD